MKNERRNGGGLVELYLDDYIFDEIREVKRTSQSIYDFLREAALDSIVRKRVKTVDDGREGEDNGETRNHR